VPLALDVDEFLRRFLLHVLPPRLVRIRYYGFLANRARAHSIDLTRQLIGGRFSCPPRDRRPMTIVALNAAAARCVSSDPCQPNDRRHRPRT